MKRLYRRGTVLRLQATNSTYPDFTPSDGQTMELWGVVTKVIKVVRKLTMAPWSSSMYGLVDETNLNVGCELLLTVADRHDRRPRVHQAPVTWNFK